MSTEIIILRELAVAHPRLLKRSVLEAEVTLSSEVSRTEIGEALNRLESKRQVRIYIGEDVTRVGLTDEGRNRLANI